MRLRLPFRPTVLQAASFVFARNANRLAIVLCAFLACLQAKPVAAAPIALTTLADEPTDLAAHTQSPFTLVLVVSHTDELPRAQQILTQAFAEDLHTLVLVQRPEHFKEDLVLRRAAKRFFTSDFSKSRVFLLQKDDNPYPHSKTLVVDPGRDSPAFQSPNLLLPDIKQISRTSPPSRPKE